MKDTTPQSHVYPSRARNDEARALEHFTYDVGMNYDAGFGSLLDDAAAADIDRTRRDHRIVEEYPVHPATTN